jgi:hypothetical protein
LKPRPIVQIQSGLTFAAAIASIGLAGKTGALGVVIAGGLGTTASAGLASRYHHLVRSRKRSRHRAERDRIMTVCLVVGLSFPAVLGALVLTGLAPNWKAPLGTVPAHVAAIAGFSVFAAMLTSSCFDWYLIRPFRDGVLGSPVCQMDEFDNETVLYYAQAWIAHRTIAEIIGWGGSAIVLIVGLVAVQQSTHNPTWSGIFTYLAPSGAVYLAIGGYLLKRLRPVPQYVQQASPGLGRWAQGTVPDVVGNQVTIDGFVVDVALGVGLQTLDAKRDRKDVALGAASRLDSTIRPLCVERCEHWIPQCERGLLEDETEIDLPAHQPSGDKGDSAPRTSSVDDPAPRHESQGAIQLPPAGA